MQCRLEGQWSVVWKGPKLSLIFHIATLLVPKSQLVLPVPFASELPPSCLFSPLLPPSCLLPISLSLASLASCRFPLSCPLPKCKLPTLFPPLTANQGSLRLLEDVKQYLCKEEVKKTLCKDVTWNLCKNVVCYRLFSDNVGGSCFRFLVSGV